MSSPFFLFTTFALLSAFALSAHAQSTAPAQSSVPGTQQSATALITDFGAKADGTTLNTAAIQAAIDSVAAKGGGTVVIPDSGTGAFLSGALFLKPGVNVHLAKGAILKGSTDVKDYPLTKTRIEGHFQDWLPALINAVETDHLTIDGEGTLDGSGTPFYAAFRTALASNRNTKNLDVPRPRLIFIQKSKDVTVAGIHLLNSGFWNLHLYNCDGVTVDGLDIRAAVGSPSTDGIDVDSSRNVTIKNTYISNNDDCIALKGSKGVFASDDKDSPPVEHIRVINCTFAMGGSLITCGSEATVVRDVVVEKCTIAGPQSQGINMLRLKLRTDTPQLYEDIHYKDITLDGKGTLLLVAAWNQYQDLQGQPPPTHTVRNISISGVKGTFGGFGSVKTAQPGDVIEGVTLEDIDVKLNAQPGANALAPVKNLVVKNVKINGVEFKPAK